MTAKVQSSNLRKLGAQGIQDTEGVTVINTQRIPVTVVLEISKEHAKD